MLVIQEICDDVGATLRGRPKFSPHPSFAYGKTHLPLKGKAYSGTHNGVPEKS